MAANSSARLFSICISSIISRTKPSNLFQFRSLSFDCSQKELFLFQSTYFSKYSTKHFCTSSKLLLQVVPVLKPKIMEQSKDEVTSSTGPEANQIAQSSENTESVQVPEQSDSNEVANSSGRQENNGNENSSSNCQSNNDAVVTQSKEESDPVGSSEGQVSQSGKDVNEGRKVLLRKKKTVLMLSYCGQGYLGMQKNPGRKTIEDDLLQSLLKSGYIDEEAYNKPQVMQFQRAARTDKNVSAARQIVSLKLPEHVDLEKVNQLLPSSIQVMGLKKVTKGFDCKSSCDARTYMYMIPTFAFVPIEQEVTEGYRITPEVLENLREALKLYLGTKNFHNFTSRRKPTDPSAKRYIISFTASDPFVKDGLEYLILRVKGQSFMLHQIRKMIGLIVAYLRGFAGKDTFVKTWTQDRIDIPKAPGVGLVLDHVHYERYNTRYGNDGMHSALTWDEVEDKVEAFCQNHIYPIITKCENEDKSMFEWLATLPYHTYDIREQKANTELPAGFSGIGNAAYHLTKDVIKDEDDSDLDSDDEGVPPKRSRVAQKVGT